MCKNRLIIELLCVEKNKAFGYNEYVFNLLDYFYNHISEIKYKKILVIHKESEEQLFAKYSDKFELIGFRFTGYFRRFYIQSKLPYILKLNKSDLVLSTSNYTGLIKKCPTILVIHDLLFKRKEWLPNRMMRWQREIYVPLSIKKADQVVGISNYTVHDVLKFYPFAKNKIRTIYNSMNFAKFKKVKDRFIDEPYFLIVCSCAFHKNVSTVLKAYNEYVHGGGSKSLVLVGNIIPNSDTGKVYDSLPISVKKNVINLYNVSNEELASLYKFACAFISASLFEGLGMPIVEALSFGTPVILSNIDIHKEVSMEQGYFFEPFDYLRLSELMTNEYRKLDIIDTIKSKFSESNTSLKYIDLINNTRWLN